MWSENDNFVIFVHKKGFIRVILMYKIEKNIAFI